MASARIELSAIFDKKTAAKMFKTDTATLVAMYRKGGNDREIAALELGRRAVNKSLKKSRKSA